MLGLCAISLVFIYIHLPIYTTLIELILYLSQRKNELHLINKLRIKRGKRQTFQRKQRNKKYCTKGLITLWWTVQLDLNFIYDLRKILLNLCVKETKTGALRSRDEQILSNNQKSMWCCKQTFSRRDWKERDYHKARIGNKFKINKWFSFRFVSIWKSTTLNTEKLVIKELWEGKEMDRNRKRENKQGKCHSTTNGCAEHIVPKHYVIRQ